MKIKINIFNFNKYVPNKLNILKSHLYKIFNK